MSSEANQKPVKKIELPGVKAFSKFLNERFPGRVDLGDIIDGGYFFKVPVLVDGKKAGDYSWKKTPWSADDDGIRPLWEHKYEGRIPGFKNKLGFEQIILIGGDEFYRYMGCIRGDKNTEIPFY